MSDAVHTTVTPLAAKDISDEIGRHITARIGGLAFNLDTIWSSVIAAVVVIGLGLILRARVTSEVPGRLQLAWESIVEQIRSQVEEQVGPTAPFVVPLAIALFTFILVANWIELIPTMEKVPAPTADVNLTYALSLVVIVWVHATAIRRKGIKGYLKHFTRPYPAFTLFMVLEEIARPVSLALRLFGNIFSGTIMLMLIGMFPVFVSPLPNAAWKLFDMFIGVIQAFILALLTILYFAAAVRTEDGH